MFILDLYRFCEGRDNFTRQDLARFIFRHRECERLARCAGVTARGFASCCSKEFIARMCTEGYLNLKDGTAWVISKFKRPACFDLRSLNARREKYILEMMKIGEMSDEELFCKKSKF